MRFDFWTNNIVCDLAPNTLRNYRERYKHNIQPVIGKMRITDAKQMHCKAILNRMHDDYAESTIRQVYIIMGALFKSALMNDVIPKQPMNGVLCTKPACAIENGMQSKVLQKLLGHSSIKMTMDRYVHVTDDSLLSAVLQFEEQQNAKMA